VQRPQEMASLSEEQSHLAATLYQDLRAAGENMSLDEVKTRIAADELTGAPC
jgi:hypothetical protein